MARPLRDDFPGAIHHVWARGNRKQPIFLGNGDFRLYLALLAGIVVSKKWRVLAYCLMPNHVHLLIETPAGGLAAGMQQLHGMYGRLFNDRHGFAGHLFQGRYGSKLVRDDLQMRVVTRYIALNPVEAELADRPAAWPWSSYPATTDGTAPRWLDTERLLGYLGIWSTDALAAYRRLVTGGLRVLE
jgi:REP element-mobilizing transposase RayT